VLLEAELVIDGVRRDARVRERLAVQSPAAEIIGIIGVDKIVLKDGDPAVAGFRKPGA
jgi:hypothetical protein